MTVTSTLYRKRASLGKCPQCGKDVDLEGRSICPQCRLRLANAARVRREKRRSEGLCQYCGKAKVAQGQAMCRECLDKKKSRRLNPGQQNSQSVKPKMTMKLLKPTIGYVRVCHDCGRATSDYRCPECRKKWLAKNGYTETVTGYFEQEYGAM